MKEETNDNTKKVIEIIDTLRKNKVNTEGLNKVLEQLLKNNTKN